MQAQIQDAINVLWPEGAGGNSAVKRAAALYLARPPHRRLLRKTCNQLRKQGTAMISSTSSPNSLGKVLQGPGRRMRSRFFSRNRCKDPNRADEDTVQLKIKVLLKRAAAKARSQAPVGAVVAQAETVAQQHAAHLSQPDSPRPRQQQQQQQLGDHPNNQPIEMQLQHSSTGGLFQPVFVLHASTYTSVDAAPAPIAVAGSGEDDAVASLLDLLPDSLRPHLQRFLQADKQPALMELLADQGCSLMAKLSDRTTEELPCSLDIPEALNSLATAKQGQAATRAAPTPVAAGRSAGRVQQQQQLRELGDLFSSDNRTGVPGTLHRIAAIRDRQGSIIGLTYRVGRHLPGTALLLGDVLSSMKKSICGEVTERPGSLLLLGRPGVGKTTLLRDIARLMSLPPSQGGLGLAVVVVDTSNEIAGDAQQRHPGVGFARRMMVPCREAQAAVLVEAVQNHAPDVIIVDEIGTPQEVAAARTIAQRGVVLIGTAHGTSMKDLLCNPVLKPLVGGVTPVTLGDVSANQSNRGQKTRLERTGAATFTTLVELQERNRWRLHMDVEASVDSLLGTSLQQQQQQPDVQVRSRDATGWLLVHFESAAAAHKAVAGTTAAAAAGGASRLLLASGHQQQPHQGVTQAVTALNVAAAARTATVGTGGQKRRRAAHGLAAGVGGSKKRRGAARPVGKSRGTRKKGGKSKA